MIRRPPRSTQSRSSAASDVYKRQEEEQESVTNTPLHLRVPHDTNTLVIVTQRKTSTLLLGRIVTRQQQQCQESQLGYNGASAVAEEGQGDTGQRNELRHSAHDQERLQAEHHRQSRSKQPGEIMPGLGDGLHLLRLS